MVQASLMIVTYDLQNILIVQAIGVYDNVVITCNDTVVK